MHNIKKLKCLCLVGIVLIGTGLVATILVSTVSGNWLLSNQNVGVNYFPLIFT